MDRQMRCAMWYDLACDDCACRVRAREGGSRGADGRRSDGRNLVRCPWRGGGGGREGERGEGERGEGEERCVYVRVGEGKGV